jgi:hypothetical protein
VPRLERGQPTIRDDRCEAKTGQDRAEEGGRQLARQERSGLLPPGRAGYAANGTGLLNHGATHQ